MKQHKSKVISLILVLTLLVCAVPLEASAASIADETATANRFNIAVSDDSPEYVREIAEKSQFYDEFEVVSLREENVKHFALADGTFKAVVYPYAIHERDADGKWVETVEFENGNVRGNRDPILYFVDASEDTYVSSYSPSSNYGSSSWLNVGASTMRAYIKFDLPTLLPNATITSCNLDICYWYNSGITTGYVTVGVYEVESSWNASTLTWNGVQNGSGALASSVIETANLYAGTGITSSNPRDEFIDIKEVVEGWYAGKTNYGIALEYMGGTNSSVGICSMEDDMYPMCWLYYTLDDLFIENGTYFLYNIQLERYLQIDPAPNSSYMELWTLDGDDDQKWEISYLHNGYYRIKSVSSGLSLGIQSGSENTNGARVVQGTYTADARQQWAFSTSPRDNIVIRPKSGENYSTDWVMTAAFGIFNGDGREVVQYAYSDNTDLKDEWLFGKSDGSAFLAAYNESIFLPRNSYFDNTRKSLNYVTHFKTNPTSTYYFTNTTVNEMISYLTSNKIFVIHTHGNKVLIRIGDDCVLYMYNLIGVDLSDLQFALLLTCSTAEDFDESHITSGNPQNITEQMAVCGAETVIGFSDTTYISDCNKFAVDLFEYLIENDMYLKFAVESINCSSYNVPDMISITKIAGNKYLKLRIGG